MTIGRRKLFWPNHIHVLKTASKNRRTWLRQIIELLTSNYCKIRRQYLEKGQISGTKCTISVVIFDVCFYIIFDVCFYIDGVLSINNPDFENYLGQMYPPELKIKDMAVSNTSASYLDLLLSIGRDGQLHTSLYDKRDDFNFHITNFPFLSSNIPSSPAYGVFISQLIRYARASYSYECFILRAVRLSNKLLGQGYVKNRLRSSLRKFYGRYGDLIKQY